MEAAVHAVVDAVVVVAEFIATRVFGRSLKVSPEKAKKIAGNFLLAVFALFFIGLAIMGVGA